MLEYKDINRDLLILEHEYDEPHKYLGSPVPPVFMNSIHVFDKLEQFESSEKDGAFVYGRNGNPTVDILERKIAALEHGKHSVVYSSGMAALTAAIMATSKAGDHIICMTEAYRYQCQNPGVSGLWGLTRNCLYKSCSRVCVRYWLYLPDPLRAKMCLQGFREQ